ncbi:MAG: adenosylcobinamide-GDP ribazoletransferase [Nitrospirota bacterium]|nr:adenosylcobinamide-GDP ribazoletransferase [Nitrospirota bacterium]
MRRILLAFQFLTIIPLSDTGEVPDREAGGATAFFPLVGAVEGAALLMLAMVLLRVFPAELVNGLLVLAMVISSGGLHLDGLADTFDAIGSRGSREKKLAIMKESTVGPFGVIAIVMALLLRFLLLNALFLNSRLTEYYAAVFLMAVFSRWAMVPVIFHSRSARRDGLGKVFIDHTGHKELLTATAFTVMIAVFAAGIVLRVPLLVFDLVFVMPVLYMVGFIAVRFFNRDLGGMTGDTFGAVYEISILLFLMMSVIWSQRYI